MRVDDPARRRAIEADYESCNAAALAAENPDRAARYAQLKLAGLREAPVHLAVFADPSTKQGHGLGRRSMPETITHSVVIAIHTLWLAARAAGVGLGWVSILNPDRVSAALDVPREWTFVGYLCLGYPELETATPELESAGWETRRRNVAEFVLLR